jgi:hypothetical protein
MSALELGTAILIGAAVLALWADTRLSERTPETMVKVLIHGIGAFVAVRLAAVVAPAVFHRGSAALTMIALFGLVLPGWIYAFLASFWAMKLVRNVLPR